MHVRKNKPVADPQAIEGLRRHAAATLHEAMGRRGAVDPAIKPIAKGMRLCGPALTVQCHSGDNIMLIKAISMAERGRVIIADMGNAVASGPFGEVLAVECAARGVNGLVVNCGVRDTREITKLGFPVFSHGVCISGTAKATLGKINHPICVGGQEVRPNDIVVGDDDGVVIVPGDEAAAVLALADERVAKEEKVMERLRAGESLFAIYGYQRVFDALQCIVEE